MTPIDTHPTLAFIGGGNMARSLIGGLIRQGWPATRIACADPYEPSRTALAEEFGIRTSAENGAIAQGSAVWLLAVKPQMMKAVCTELHTTSQSQKPLVLSIAAGISLNSLAAWLGAEARLIRSMPNTPALLGAGVTALFAQPAVSAEERGLAQRLLAAAGSTVWLESEALMDAVTAVSGSGPAYFFLLIEAMQAAARAQGLPPDVAAKLVTETALGAARMVCEGGEDAALLRQRVTSPGGTTQAALEVLERSGFREHVQQAIAKATQRGAQLSLQFGD